MEKVMGKIGILAFGSVMNRPDIEIESATAEIVDGIVTDFSIEFARSSDSRAKAPTLAVVTTGGATVKGKLFILKEVISLEEAQNILLRRENDKVGNKNEKYTGPRTWMEIKEHSPSNGCEKIIYASMIQNITNPTAAELAKLAIESCKKHPMKNGSRADGIQYLSDMKQLGIKTPLTDQYEAEILKHLEVDSLEKALEKTKAPEKLSSGA